MPVSAYLLLAALLPLAASLLLLFLGTRFAGLAGPFATFLVLTSLGLSASALVVWVAKPEFNQPHYVEALTSRWLPLPSAAAPPLLGEGPIRRVPESPAPSPAISVGWLIDSLTVAMFVLITLVASVVHLFSLAHMEGDPRLPRYFAYLGLLTFAMLALVLSNSIVQLFAFWQLAVLAAALLVGFWFERRGPAMAGLKLLLVNHLGDAAFLMGLAILAAHVGAAGLTFYDAQGTSILSDSVRDALRVQSSEFLYFTGAGPDAFLGLHWLTWAGLLMFAGAAAKTAQFPLHVWMPDAGEAPAPAAALIQSVTMVGSGVYLVARLFPILTLDARFVIALIGCITLLLGALLAIVQTDLRKLLAYSTISQAGYMMLFLGAGAYTSGLLHLFTHVFFKAGLLIAAGSVILSIGNESDLRQMGGLWRKMPLTAIGFSAAALAIVGTPYFSGAYSTQMGLAGVYLFARALAAATGASPAMLLFYVPVLTLFLTAFGIGRCGWLVFGGKSRNEKIAENAHESFLLVLPLAILAIMSFNIYEFFGLPSLIIKSLPTFAAGGPPVIRADAHLEQALAILATRAGGYGFWGFLAAALGVAVYWKGFAFADRVRRLPVLNLVYLWLREGMFFDALYNALIVGGTLVAANLAKFADRFIFHAAARFLALSIRALARLAAHVDQGFLDRIVTVLAATTHLASRAVVQPRQPRIRR